MKVIQKASTMLFATVVVWLGSASILFAQAANVDPIPGYGNDLVGWIVTMLQYLIALAGIIAAAVLIMNGFMYITASGDEGKIQKATKGITYAIIGLVIAAIAFLIVNFVVGQLERASEETGYDIERTVEFVA
jgi:hypothetical protein